MDGRDSMNAARQQALNQIGAEIEEMTHTLSQTPDNHPDMPLLLVRLGSSYDDRFDLVGDPSDIDISIEYTNIALTLTPEHYPILPTLLAQLGVYHGKRFQRLREVNDSDQSIEYASLATALTPNGHSVLPDMYANLGRFYDERFQSLGELDDLEKALEHKTHAVELTPSGDSGLPSRLASLGGSYSSRFERLGGRGDIEKAIEYQSRAVALTPKDHPNFSRHLATLAVSYANRFGHLGVLNDLEKAIEYEFNALILTPDGHPDLPGQLANLATSHMNRFGHLGELNDLEIAIEYQFRALTLTPDAHPSLPALLSNLGISLSTRFERLGQLSDLEKAITYESRAVASTPDGHPHLPPRLGNLAVSLTTRFQRLRELGDLDKAIECESRALALTPDSHPSYSSYLHNLSASYSDRYRHSRKIEDIEKAIEYESRVLAVTPNGHPSLVTRLHGLGVDHSRRYFHLRQREDIDKVIEYMTCALQLTSDGDPRIPSIHYALAAFRHHQFRLTGDPSHSQDSLASFRVCSQSLAGSPRDKFKYAIRWASIAYRQPSLCVLEAYQTAIDLLPQFIWLGATTTQRYDDLSEAETLAVDAAASAIKSCNYSLALEWLDHARCVVWSQSLMLRSPLDELHSAHPGVATRLREAATQLQHASFINQPTPARSAGLVDQEQSAREHRRLAQEYADLLARARALPGFEGLLQPMQANRLVGAARSGPVVVINCHKVHCDALAIIPGEQTIQHIPLPNFTSATAQSTRLEMEGLVRNSQQMERGVERRPVLEDRVEFETVVNTLWYGVVKPILDHLGYMEAVPDDNLPHITWCPTGSLSFLPLHAAGDYSQPRCRVFDYVISSYTPTLSALLSSAPSSLSSNSRMLAIGQPNTPGHSRLPGTIKEVQCVMTHTSGKARYTQLIGDQATKGVVLDAMKHHDWVHLACHAHQNVSDPTKSGFFLHDGTLDLASINQLSFQNKGLAYLSACQTATGDEKLPDEAIHLASGMLMAGYSSVIATMWSVMDDDAPFVADQFYSRVMKDGTLGNGEAGKALHYAVGELRDRVGEQEFRRWVPYIHIGS